MEAKGKHQVKERGSKVITEDAVDEAGLLSMYVKGVAVLRL